MQRNAYKYYYINDSAEQNIVNMVSDVNQIIYRTIIIHIHITKSGIHDMNFSGVFL